MPKIINTAKEIAVPAYLSRLEQACRVLAAVGLSTLAVSGGLAVKNEVQGMIADSGSVSAETFQAEAVSAGKAADKYGAAARDGLIAVGGGVAGLAGLGIGMRSDTRRLRRLEEMQQQTSSQPIQ